MARTFDEERGAKSTKGKKLRKQQVWKNEEQGQSIDWLIDFDRQ